MKYLIDSHLDLDLLDIHIGNLFDLLENSQAQGNQSRPVYFCLLLWNMALTLALAYGYWC